MMASIDVLVLLGDDNTSGCAPYYRQDMALDEPSWCSLWPVYGVLVRDCGLIFVGESCNIMDSLSRLTLCVGHRAFGVSREYLTEYI